ncbi:L-2-hydroxyglutarate oxidase [bacterium]|nr:L-2-hydroxyglutarate oxidase [bacterium]
METCDVVIVGGGIVGMATAVTLQQRHKNLRITVVEAESRVAAHQTGHNSGVLHSGIYYKPGSDKARLCCQGKTLMEVFCDEHQIAWDRCGKVVVATSQPELKRLETISSRAEKNGVAFERVDSKQLRELEPHVVGFAGLHVPGTGIVNYRDVCKRMSQLFVDRGGTLRLTFQVRKISHVGASLGLHDSLGEQITCGKLINCAGLQSDRVCKMAGGETDLRIVPFRGEYYDLTKASNGLCRNLIYPVPDPSFPFLGVHFTRMIDGGVECGPNAVFALSRSGYRWSQVNAIDLFDAVSFRGFRALAIKHWRMGAGEIHRSLSKRAFVKALKKLIPQIESSDLKAGRAGVRAQAVTPAGELFDDFLIVPSKHAIHVLNAPSPAATSSLAIARSIANVFEELPDSFPLHRSGDLG